jgi:lipopolysaccharide/colanic/teichoic acid biosynthesis glycosyltransferase
MGELQVPADALWGAQTQRAVDNFPISGLPMPRGFIAALGLVKWAAAGANAELGLMKSDVAVAVQKAALEVADGQYDAHFPIDVFQTGSGTSSNMNANEVIAHLATGKLGADVHPVESGVVKQATKDDPRVTEVGRFIRRTSIDELPQLMNVIVGDMSLVGPRPHAVQHNDFYSRKINAYLARHRIKPGITGLAQVRGFRGETEDLDLMAERVTSDIEYINNWSLALDLSILFRTAFTLFDDRAY